jgi:hypothetical protein
MQSFPKALGSLKMHEYSTASSKGSPTVPLAIQNENILSAPLKDLLRCAMATEYLVTTPVDLTETSRPSFEPFPILHFAFRKEPFMTQAGKY